MMIANSSTRNCLLFLLICALATVVLANTELLEFIRPLSFSAESDTCLAEDYGDIPISLNLGFDRFCQSSSVCGNETYSTESKLLTPLESAGSSFSRWLWYTAGSILASLIHWYSASLESRPVLTKSLTSGLMAALGDILAQIIEAKEARCETRNTTSLQLRRVCSVAAEGVFVSGPLMHLGYEILETHFPIFADEIDPSESRNAWAMTFCQVFVDMFIMDSIFVATLMITSAFLEGRRNEILRELSSAYVPTIRVSWFSSLCFLPVQCLSFKYIPFNFRVAAINFQDIAWNAIVSYMAHRSEEKLEQDIEKENDHSFEPMRAT